MSLDGYIAGPNGESDWIVIDPDFDFKALFDEFDTLLIGRKTFEAVRRGGQSAPSMRTAVFSKTLDPAECPGVILSENPTETIGDLRKQSGKDLWLFGGGGLFASLLALKLVDAVEIAIVPVLLGQGVPLLPAVSAPTRLKLADHRTYAKTGTVWMQYEVCKTP